MAKKKVKLASLSRNSARNVQKMLAYAILLRPKALNRVESQSQTQAQTQPEICDPESLMRQRIAEAKDRLEKLKKENRKKEMTLLMNQCLAGKGLEGLSLEDLLDLGGVIQEKLEEIERIQTEALKKTAAFPLGSSPPPGPSAVGDSSGEKMVEEFDVNDEKPIE